MKAVESKYHGYPWAFVWPRAAAETGPIEHAGMVRAWLESNDLVHNRDYVAFEIDEAPRGSQFQNWTYCIAFKDRSKALMFKVAWA